MQGTITRSRPHGDRPRFVVPHGRQCSVGEHLILGTTPVPRNAVRASVECQHRIRFVPQQRPCSNFASCPLCPRRVVAARLVQSAPEVACRQLGYATGFFPDFLAARRSSNAAALPWLAALQCSGSEAEVLECET